MFDNFSDEDGQDKDRDGDEDVRGRQFSGRQFSGRQFSGRQFPGRRGRRRPAEAWLEVYPRFIF